MHAVCPHCQCHLLWCLFGCWQASHRAAQADVPRPVHAAPRRRQPYPEHVSVAGTLPADKCLCAAAGTPPLLLCHATLTDLLHPSPPLSCTCCRCERTSRSPLPSTSYATTIAASAFWTTGGGSIRPAHPRSRETPLFQVPITTYVQVFPCQELNWICCEEVHCCSSNLSVYLCLHTYQFRTIATALWWQLCSIWQYPVSLCLMSASI
jgi:hypothetical protein